MSEDNKYKGAGHKWLTEGLFLEHMNNPEHVLYTLQPWDRKYKGRHIPSLHKLFVEMEDIGEFEFANKYFDGYQHWLRVKARPFFKEYYAAMVSELNAKMASRSLKAMREQAAEGTASQATLKYLAENEYMKKGPVGRPSKKRAPRKEGNVVQADFERITKK